jgi:radical SAM-linked protein
MEPMNVVLAKALKIKHALVKYKFIKITYHTIELSYLETILGRGGSDVGMVIEQAYKNGAKFEAWKECFDYNIWLKSADEVGFDWQRYIDGFELNEKLPYDNIDIGITKEFLLSEYEKAKYCTSTEDCRNGECAGCGVQRYTTCHVTSADTTFSAIVNDSSSRTHNGEPCSYRVYFSKTNDLKYLSHLDFLRLIHRLLMLSELPIAFSQGFNPHPKTSFCPPLSSGIEGENEFFDIQLSQKCELNQILTEISKKKIKDLDFHRVEQIVKSTIPIGNYLSENVCVEFDNEKITALHPLFDRYLASSSFPFTRERKGKTKTVDLKEIISKIEIYNNKLYITKKIQGASVFDILENIFNIERDSLENLKIVRKEINF